MYAASRLLVASVAMVSEYGRSDSQIAKHCDSSLKLCDFTDRCHADCTLQRCAFGRGGQAKTDPIAGNDSQLRIFTATRPATPLMLNPSILSYRNGTLHTIQSNCQWSDCASYEPATMNIKAAIVTEYSGN